MIGEALTPFERDAMLGRIVRSALGVPDDKLALLVEAAEWWATNTDRGDTRPAFVVHLNEAVGTGRSVTTRTRRRAHGNKAAN